MKKFVLILTVVSAGSLSLLADNVNVEFYTPRIVRVTKTPESVTKDLEESKIVIANPEDVKVAKSNNDGVSSYKSSALTVAVDKKTDKVSFSLPNGELLLAEGFHSFTPIESGLDKGAYTVMQSFALDPDEPIYGIGMMQNGKMSLRGEHRKMQQSNLEDFAHFFQSIKGYGV